MSRTHARTGGQIYLFPRWWVGKTCGGWAAGEAGGDRSTGVTMNALRAFISVLRTHPFRPGSLSSSLFRLERDSIRFRRKPAKEGARWVDRGGVRTPGPAARAPIHHQRSPCCFFCFLFPSSFFFFPRFVMPPRLVYVNACPPASQPPGTTITTTPGGQEATPQSTPGGQAGRQAGMPCLPRACACPLGYTYTYTVPTATARRIIYNAPLAVHPPRPSRTYRHA